MVPVGLMGEFKARELNELLDSTTLGIPTAEQRTADYLDTLKRFKVFHLAIVPLVVVGVHMTTDGYLFMYAVLNALLYACTKLIYVGDTMVLFVFVIDAFFFWKLGMFTVTVKLAWAWFCVVLIHVFLRTHPPPPPPTTTTTTAAEV